MLALNEKARAVILLLPELVPSDRNKNFRARLAESYVEVVAEKQMYLTEADAKAYFQFDLPEDVRTSAMVSATWGLSQVLLVEHLDGDVLERVDSLVSEISWPVQNVFYSTDSWECVRDIEFFCPHLDSLPVERTLAVLKPDGLARGVMDGRSLEQLVEAEVAAAGLFIVGRKQFVPDKATAELFCQDLKGSADFAGAVGVLLQEPGIVALCLEGRGAIGKWHLICGPASSTTARGRAPSTVRANWGTDSTSNAVHGSRDMAASEKELKHVFPEGSLKLQRTLCIVKPDGMQNILAIRAAIKDAGFTVLKEKQTTLAEERAKEFYRSLKGKPSYGSTVKEACSGPCTVIVLCRLEAVAVLKQLMGPEHSKDARLQRPRSLRALYGRDGQRNAVFGSESAKNASWDICFFFPEMGSDPVPDDEEVRDFLFRKAAGVSMDLKTLTNTEASGFTADPTLQQLLSKGLMALCQVQPKGVQAAKWLSQWLTDNNPNQPAMAPEGAAFAPPERTQRFVEFGVNQDGMPFAVEAPRAAPKLKGIVEVDVSQERALHRTSEFSKPPFVVFVIGGPGSGKGTVCARLRDEFKMVHLSTGDLMRDELKSGSALGQEIQALMEAGQLVPDSTALQIIKKAMLKHQDTNRFLLDGYPRTLEQAKTFEQDVAEVAFIVNLECSAETMVNRILYRAQQAPGRADDNAEVAANRVQVFQNSTIPVLQYYTPIGKVRKVQGEASMEEVYAESRRYFQSRFLYLLGPPGAPVAALGERLQSSYGYASINLHALLKSYAASNVPDAEKARAALAVGKPVDASIACPLVLQEIHRNMAVGVQNFVLCDFPQSIKQAEFVEFQVPSITKTMLLDFSQADTGDLVASASAGSDAVELELRAKTFFGTETKNMINNMTNLVRVPCNLSALENFEAGAVEMSFHERVFEGTWQSLRKKVMPGITLVLGLPGSGTEKLAPLLAARTPNTQAVDCNQLLDKELERRTERGMIMNNMLAKGQVVPLSMTMELLKGVANLTASDSLVIENCPMYVDQIDTIAYDFRIDRVFYISGSPEAEQSWAAAYANPKDQDYFQERKTTLGPIVANFSKLGVLQRIDVTETPQEDQLWSAIEFATKPQYIVLSGLSSAITGKQSDMIAAALGFGKPARVPDGAVWSALDLKKYAIENNLSTVVIDRLSVKNFELADLSDLRTKLAVNIVCDDEFLEEEWKAAHEDEEFNSETFTARIADERSCIDSCLASLSAGSLISIDRKSVKTAEEMHQLIRKELLPKVYLIVAPSGKVDMGAMMAEMLCTFPSSDSSKKITVVDASQLCTRGGHSPAVEDALRKATARGEPAGCLPLDVWVVLFNEAFAESADPTGNFVVINFPVMTTRPGYNVQDQLAFLPTISALQAVAVVLPRNEVLSEFFSPRSEDIDAYNSICSKVVDQVILQFGENCLHNVVVDGPCQDGVFFVVQQQLLEGAAALNEIIVR